MFRKNSSRSFRLASHKLPIKTRFVISDIELTEEELARYSKFKQMLLNNWKKKLKWLLKKLLKLPVKLKTVDSEEQVEEVE